MHALGGMDTGDEEGGDDEGGNADQERGHVEGQDDEPGDLHGDRADVVGLGIEAHEAREVLEGDEAQAQGIAPKQALGQDERGKPQEDVAHLLVLAPRALSTPIICVRSRMMMSRPETIVTIATAIISPRMSQTLRSMSSSQEKICGFISVTVAEE